MSTAIAERQESAVVVQAESATILQVIQRAAADPQCDIEKMERLLAMKERMDARAAEVEFNDALSRVQANMGRVAADATNNQTRSAYATYGKLDKALRPVYTAEGFSLSFGTEEAPEGMVGMICFVSHRSGHTRQYRAHVPSDGKGAKGGDVMTKTHAFGSGTSYGMRYLLKMIFNVAIGEEDDDGNAADNDDLRNAVLGDLVAKVKAAKTGAELQGVWQSGLKVLQAAKDVAGADELRAAVTSRKAELEKSK
ncbi:ERF family protein [Pseudomonas multiresinivorans]|uniref:Single-stranded DNA-binding protein n=1 Tax=Pseudomonas multiresinivorans TaxID=95301 RepID=A0A7Z3BLK2_9PSED|nr:ERF family protein [Pseudomonas multiresinivorans]QJP09047.1 single-stranded DNA-binding protein [Pseudomonas multiresinivorans]